MVVTPCPPRTSCRRATRRRGVYSPPRYQATTATPPLSLPRPPPLSSLGGGGGGGGGLGANLRAINWDLSKLPVFEKNFYYEHPDVTARCKFALFSR